MKISYITQKDKNGKTLYYRVTDGKKKVISRAAYEVYQQNSKLPDSSEQVEFQPKIATQNTQITLDEVSTIETSHTNSDEETADSRSAADILLSISKNAIEAAGSKHSGKICLREYKNCTLVKYRNCMICAILYDKQRVAYAVQFMGTSLETRNKSKDFKIGSLDALSTLEDEIIKQTTFIDWWWENTACVKKAS